MNFWKVLLICVQNPASSLAPEALDGSASKLTQRRVHWCWRPPVATRKIVPCSSKEGSREGLEVGTFASAAFLRGPGWGGRTHRVGLGTGGLAPEVGGDDGDEELQDGEDGKHSQVAPAHILGTQNPTVKASREF